MMDSIDEIREKLLAFRDERDWAQFHNPKDLALAINIEAGLAPYYSDNKLPRLKK